MFFEDIKNIFEQNEDKDNAISMSKYKFATS